MCSLNLQTDWGLVNGAIGTVHDQELSGPPPAIFPREERCIKESFVCLELHMGLRSNDKIEDLMRDRLSSGPGASVTATRARGPLRIDFGQAGPTGGRRRRIQGRKTARHLFYSSGILPCPKTKRTNADRFASASQDAVKGRLTRSAVMQLQADDLTLTGG